MKRPVLIVLLFCLIGPLAEAQLWKMKRYEATAGLGSTQFFGDVGGFSQTINILGFRDLSFLQTRVNVNLSFKYRITQEINARLNFNYGLFHATDERGSNEGRGYEASISFLESSLIGEYYFIKNRAERSYLFTKRRRGAVNAFFKSLDFYFFTGIGGLRYSIKPNDALSNHGLDPIGFAPVVPVGVGSTIVFSPNFNFGVEFSGRYSFSDNIDGYTSQFSSSNDVYYFFNFTVTYKLKSGPNGLPSFR